MKKIAIIGAGAFGHSLTLVLHKQHSVPMSIYDINTEWIAHIQEHRKHPMFHTEHSVLDHVTATTDHVEALSGADVVILAVPAQFMRGALEKIHGSVEEGALVINVAKGIEMTTEETMSQILGEFFTKHNIATLSGGMIAADLVDGVQVGATVACSGDKSVVVELFAGTTLDIDFSDDLIGVELSGSLKNVLAIGAGMCEGLSMNKSGEAYVVVKLAKELTTLAVSLGAKEETFSTTYCWLGDLLTTAYGNSRNRWFGEQRGRGKTTEEILNAAKEEHKTVEGVSTAAVVYQIIGEKSLELPMLETLNKIIKENKEPNSLRNCTV